MDPRTQMSSLSTVITLLIAPPPCAPRPTADPPAVVASVARAGDGQSRMPPDASQPPRCASPPPHSPLSFSTNTGCKELTMGGCDGKTPCSCCDDKGKASIWCQVRRVHGARGPARPSTTPLPRTTSCRDVTAAFCSSAAFCPSAASEPLHHPSLRSTSR